MDTEPIYELRERLRAAAMAGTNLLSEDFRLKRAYEAFKPLEAASPVFAKVGQLTVQLLSPDCQNPQGALLDTITLVDAVICTLGAVDVKGEVESAGIISTERNTGSLIVNAPYSMLKELLEALTTSGSGHYGYVCDTYENHPELFQDYRVKYTLVQALGASYAELADKVEQWLKEDNDKSILPLMYKDFDPKGKKEMVRRVRVISALAGAEANDFYIRMLEEAQKDVRQELIFALRYEPENISLLFDMVKKEKGKNKETVFRVLANMEDEQAAVYFKEAAKKKPESVIKYLTDAAASWAAEVIEEICDNAFEKFDAFGNAQDSEQESNTMASLLYDIVRAIFGKGGVCICRCYRKLLERKEKINGFLANWRKHKQPLDQWTWQYDVLWNDLRYRNKPEMKNIEGGLGMILQQSLVVNPDPDLQALAMELYESEKKSDIYFLSAAVTAKLSNDEDCVEWLERQVTDKVLMVSKFSKGRMEMVREAAAYIRWDRKKGDYRFYGSYCSSFQPEVLSFERPAQLSHAEEIIEWFKSHAAKETDGILSRWIPLNDEKMCKKMGEYFYKRALVTADNSEYLGYMKKVGWKDCKGLGVKFVKNHPKDINSWRTYDFLRNMPGGEEAYLEEVKEICNMVDRGEIKVDMKEYEKFKIRVEV